MARYIDADKFIDWLDIGHLRSPSEICYSEGDVKIMIDMQQTADVVEVVRCKDCQWFSVHNKDGCYRPGLDHHAQMTPVYENDYCSYGTPKERGGEK